MTDKERIEILKDKGGAQAFGLLDPKFRDILEKVGISRCLIFDGNIGWIFTKTDEFYQGLTYILDPNYEPEPEYIEIEIVLFNGSCRLKEQSPNNRGKKLCNVIGDQGFVCFHDDFSMETTNAGDLPGWMRQLAAQDGVFKVHARFIRSSL